MTCDTVICKYTIMYTLVKNNDYICVRLEEDDFGVFKSAFTACTAEKEAPDINLTDVINKTDGECLRVFFEDPDVDHFVLLEKEQDGDLSIIGEARICYHGDRAELEDLHILESERGQRLSDLLHEARLLYLANEEPQISFVTLHIYDWNIPSIKAAKRNGFRESENKTGGNFLPFSRNLDDLRAPVPAVLECDT